MHSARALCPSQAVVGIRQVSRIVIPVLNVTCSGDAGLL